jgi:hypothetical protein
MHHQRAIKEGKNNPKNNRFRFDAAMTESNNGKP